MELKKPKISKLDAAGRQIDTAIRLLFDNGDLVSIHTLVSASGEILNDLCKARSVKTVFDDAIELHVRPERRSEFLRALKAPANFFKHASRDPNDLIELFDPEANDPIIFAALARYEALGRQPTQEMAVFRIWFISIYTNLFLDSMPFKNLIQTAYAPIVGLPHAARLKFGKMLLLSNLGHKAEALREFDKLSERYPAEMRQVSANLDPLIASMT